jgi:hypothetical protein
MAMFTVNEVKRDNNRSGPCVIQYVSGWRRTGDEMFRRATNVRLIRTLAVHLYPPQ